MTSLHLTCGLGPPQSKVLATPVCQKLEPEGQLHLPTIENRLTRSSQIWGFP